jgi:hypothetical protein
MSVRSEQKEELREKRVQREKRVKRGKQGYLPKERAVCIVVYDLGGKPIPTETVDEILTTVNDLSLSRGLMISFTQT